MISKLKRKVQSATRHLKFLLRRKLLRIELQRLMQDIQDNLEYQQWLEQELVNAKFQRLEMQARLGCGKVLGD